MERSARYDWDEHNVGHIAVHGVETSEVEEVLANHPVHIETRTDPRSSEERILELGNTNAGRVLFVALTPRRKRIRPVTAFDANRKTRSDYLKKKTP